MNCTRRGRREGGGGGGGGGRGGGGGGRKEVENLKVSMFKFFCSMCERNN